MPQNSVYSSSEEITDRIAENARDAKNAIMDKALEAKNRTLEAGQAARDRIEGMRTSTASSLHNAAAKLHGRADNIPGVDRASSIMHATADRLNRVADYMRDKDTKQMLGDVESTAKRHPTQSLLIAAAFGFLLGRALRR